MGGPTPPRYIFGSVRPVISAVNWDPAYLQVIPKLSTYQVRDNTSGKWKNITLSGNSPKERIFENWLVTSEMSMIQISKGEDNPGHQEERSFRTLEPPNVQQEFATYLSYDRFIPGRLTLTNLRDGRQLVLSTETEDSEVLAVRGTDVIYRINNSIFQATILASGLSPGTLVAEDVDVPEIHWAFFAKNEKLAIKDHAR